MDQRVYIFDTTLRDGEQAVGINLNRQEKVQIAHNLAAMKVDIIEAGFPIASEGDFQAVRAIASEVEGPVIAALARTGENDIRRAAQALEGRRAARIHTFIATSPIHMEYKLKMSPQEVIRRARDAVALAASLVPDVEFSAEDASRSDPQFLMEIFSEAIAAGATTINIPDTVGYAMPQEFAQFVKKVMEGTDGASKARWSVHVHNDLGVAVANSLAAVQAGARQVECTVNGLGERAGNASLEEFVMALRTRKDLYNLDTALDSTKIYDTSRLVSRLTGIAVPPNKAIVGDNAFAHESGIHQHGVLCKRETYEIMDPKDIGAPDSKIVLGKHSGKHALAMELQAMGYNLEEQQMERAFKAFKDLCDRKEKISRFDLEALVADEILSVPAEGPQWEIRSFAVQSTADHATASLTLMEQGQERTDAATGNGPIDASYAAIRRIIGFEPTLRSYQITALTERSDALGQATVSLQMGDRVVYGRASSTDIVEASIKAYVNALNRMSQIPERAETISAGR